MGKCHSSAGLTEVMLSGLSGHSEACVCKEIRQPRFILGPNFAKLPCFQASTGHRVNSKAEEIKLQVSGTHDFNVHCHCNILKILEGHFK